MQSLVNQLDLKTALPGLVIIDSARSGESNMAIDEALLQKATPQWPIVLRIYRWDRPTLSIGHFQRIQDRQGDPRLSDLPWVRRKTGGGAIVHDQELTYSILIPNGNAQSTKGHNETLYRGIHLAFLENLKRLGWSACLAESCTCKTTAGKESEAFLCFLRRSPVDLLVGRDKILGSAQRRSATGLIQHGSFLLRRAQTTPELLGLLDLADSIGQKQDLEDSRSISAAKILKDEFACGLGLDWTTHSQSSQMETWIEFFVASLKSGVSQLLQVNWQNGKLSDVLENLDCGGAGRN